MWMKRAVWRECVKSRAVCWRERWGVGSSVYQRVLPPVYKRQPHPTLTFTPLSYQPPSQGSFIFATRFTQSFTSVAPLCAFKFSSSKSFSSQASLQFLSSLLNFDSRQSPSHIWRGGLLPPCFSLPTPPTPNYPPPESHSTPCMSLPSHYPCDRQDSWSVIGGCVDQ